MPDPLLIVSALAVAAAASAVSLWVFGWPSRAARPVWTGRGWVVGVGFGFFVGCWVLEIRPHWLPREDLDRLLVLVVPAIVLVELLASFSRVPRWLIWPLRMVIVAGNARVLLHGTSYITDLTGPGTSAWSPSLAALIFGALAALEAAVWALISLLARRAPGPSLPVCLAVVSAGAGVTIMLSGYATGGMIGLPLAAALLGATAAALVLARSSRVSGPLGVPIVGLFSLLVIGRFFGALSSVHAVLLFCAPLLGWLIELPHLRRLPVWARGLARVVVVGILVLGVVMHAQRKFVADSQSKSGSAPNESSVQDYLDFGR